MDVRRLQLLLAYGALIFVPWPSLRPFEFSLTFGDVFLIGAVLLNADQLFQLRPFQVPLLLSFPFVLISQVMDPDGGIVEIMQTIYIFGVLLPFGHLAFANMEPKTFLSVFLSAQGVSCSVAVLQMLGVVGPIGQQLLWETREATRAAGLNMSCSGLCMCLTSLFCLLPYLSSYRQRVFLLCIIGMGMLATLAKSTIFAIPALFFFLVWEPNRNRVLTAMGIIAVAAGGAWAFSADIQNSVASVYDSVFYRVENAEFSVYERMSTLNYALGQISNCVVVGLGYNGTSITLTQHLNNTVHVYHVGLILIGGMVCTAFHYWGYFLMMKEALGLRQPAIIIVILSHWLSVCTMTVLMHSFQYTPYLMCGAILNYCAMEHERRQRLPKQKSQAKPVKATLPSARAA